MRRNRDFLRFGISRIVFSSEMPRDDCSTARCFGGSAAGPQGSIPLPLLTERISLPRNFSEFREENFPRLVVLPPVLGYNSK